MNIRMEILREKARLAARDALARYPPIPEHLRHDLTLGVLFLGDSRVFELYLPGERPEDAVVLARVEVNSLTGEAGTVEVFPERWSQESDPASHLGRDRRR